MKYTGDRITFYNVIGFQEARDKLNSVYRGGVIIVGLNLVSENNPRKCNLSSARTIIIVYNLHKFVLCRSGYAQFFPTRFQVTE